MAAERHAQELTEAVSRTESETLTLDQAATESGYAKRTLRQKLAKGEIVNAGRRNAPRIRRGDLPSRRRSGGTDAFDPTAEAHGILSSKHCGRSTLSPS